LLAFQGYFKELNMSGKIRRNFEAVIMAVLLGNVAIAEPGTSDRSSAANAAESVEMEMETVGGHLKVTRLDVADNLPLQTIYLNGAQVYQDYVWGLSLDHKLRVGPNDVIVIDLLSGGNTECVDGHAVLGVRPNKTTWMAQNINYGCAVTFAVVGDQLVITNVTYEGRRHWTDKTLISMDGVVTHAR